MGYEVPNITNDTFGFYQLVLRKHACRLRYILHQLNRGELHVEDLKRNIEYAALVLETAYMDESRRLCEEDDDLEVVPEAVPEEVREWLAATFTKQHQPRREKPRFKSVANAIRTGIFFDKLFRKVSEPPEAPIPSHIAPALKEVGSWNFDVFKFNELTEGHALQWVGMELFNRYGFLSRFKIPTPALEAFLLTLEQGYSKYGNPYHNLIHAADVTQTTHFMLSQTGFLEGMSELESFAAIYAAMVHDFEHTGHTNNFHVQSGSELSLFYNDKSVLENHHLSATFRFMKRDNEMNIIAALSRDEYREFRNMVIEIVLATDMSTHFVQVKTMKNMLTLPEGIDKSKAICLLVHCCDISHPAKPWNIHSNWSSHVLEEFFRQGDLEATLGLPYSPLCDRHTVHVAESQIGFIDFIVEPTMVVCGEMLLKLVEPLVAMAPNYDSESGSALNDDDKDSSAALSVTPSFLDRRSSSIRKVPLTVEGRLDIPQPWLKLLHENKAMWKEKAAAEEAERKRKQQAQEDQAT